MLDGFVSDIWEAKHSCIFVQFSIYIFENRIYHLEHVLWPSKHHIWQAQNMRIFVKISISIFSNTIFPP